MDFMVPFVYSRNSMGKGGKSDRKTGDVVEQTTVAKFIVPSWGIKSTMS
jgi:hypothetical protein